MSGKLISISNQKGGIGKSSVTLLLGSELGRIAKGKRIIIADADSQKSVIKVVEAEDELNPFPFEAVDLSGLVQDREALKKQISELLDEFDYVIVDTKGKRENFGENEEILLMADMIIVPVQPTSLAIDATTDTLNDYTSKVKPLYEKHNLQPPLIRAWWLLPVPSEFKSIKKKLKLNFDEYLKKEGIEAFKDDLCNWAEIEQSIAYSAPVSSIKSGGKAVKTVRLVAKHIIKLLN